MLIRKQKNYSEEEILNALLEKAFCEGYSYAQKEYAGIVAPTAIGAAAPVISTALGVAPIVGTAVAAHKLGKRIMPKLTNAIDNKVNNAVSAVKAVVKNPNLLVDKAKELAPKAKSTGITAGLASIPVVGPHVATARVAMNAIKNQNN